MEISLQRLWTASRAAALALVIGAVALPVVPALGQGEPQSSFSLELGAGGAQVQIEGGRRDGGGGRDNDYEEDYGDDYCLDDRAIRRGLRDYGFRDIDIRRDLGRDRVEVYATYGRWTYKMRVDRCTGEVDRVQRVRRAGGGGFGLHFDYGSGY